MKEKTTIKQNGQIMLSCSDWIFMGKLTKKLRKEKKNNNIILKKALCHQELV